MTPTSRSGWRTPLTLARPGRNKAVVVTPVLVVGCLILDVRPEALWIGLDSDFLGAAGWAGIVCGRK